MKSLLIKNTGGLSAVHGFLNSLKETGEIKSYQFSPVMGSIYQVYIDSESSFGSNTTELDYPVAGEIIKITTRAIPATATTKKTGQRKRNYLHDPHEVAAWFANRFTKIGLEGITVIGLQAHPVFINRHGKGSFQSKPYQITVRATVSDPTAFAKAVQCGFPTLLKPYGNGLIQFNKETV